MGDLEGFPIGACSAISSRPRTMDSLGGWYVRIFFES